MNNKDRDFESLVEIFRSTNGLTKKSAERLIVDLISNKDKLNNFKDVINILEKNYGICPNCFYFTENDICSICSNESREQNIICIVSTILDANNIEQNGKYKGLYAILGGEINLVKSISPDDLNITQLFKRVNDQTELILALNATFEGEVTANYIGQYAKKQGIKVSRIAKGIPTGGMLDYMDESTLESALNNRKSYGGK